MVGNKNNYFFDTKTTRLGYAIGAIITTSACRGAKQVKIEEQSTSNQQTGETQNTNTPTGTRSLEEEVREMSADIKNMKNSITQEREAFNEFREALNSIETKTEQTAAYIGKLVDDSGNPHIRRQDVDRIAETSSHTLYLMRDVQKDVGIIMRGEHSQKNYTSLILGGALLAVAGAYMLRHLWSYINDSKKRKNTIQTVFQEEKDEEIPAVTPKVSIPENGPQQQQAPQEQSDSSRLMRKLLTGI